MKTYQVFEVVSFPRLALGDSDVTVSQLAMFGDQEEIETHVTFVRRDLAGGFDEFRVRSQIKVLTFGRIRYYDAASGQTVTKEFTEYLKPVDFLMYLHREEAFVAMQAPRIICKKVKQNINARSHSIRLRERQVDFKLVQQHQTKFAGAWFRRVSANIHAEGMHGENVQDDARFKELLQIAELSSLTVKYDYEAAHHKVMITGSSAVVFQQTYRTLDIELALLLSVKQSILNDAWKPVD